MISLRYKSLSYVLVYQILKHPNNNPSILHIFFFCLFMEKLSNTNKRKKQQQLLITTEKRAKVPTFYSLNMKKIIHTFRRHQYICKVIVHQNNNAFITHFKIFHVFEEYDIMLFIIIALVKP